jgi:hypothetical protein
MMSYKSTSDVAAPGTTLSILFLNVDANLWQGLFLSYSLLQSSLVCFIFSICLSVQVIPLTRVECHES